MEATLVGRDLRWRGIENGQLDHGTIGGAATDHRRSSQFLVPRSRRPPGAGVLPCPLPAVATGRGLERLDADVGVVLAEPAHHPESGSPGGLVDLGPNPMTEEYGAVGVGVDAVGWELGRVGQVEPIEGRVRLIVGQPLRRVPSESVDGGRQHPVGRLTDLGPAGDPDSSGSA